MLNGAEKRPVWFKLFLHQKTIIDAVPDEAAGKAIKAAMAYFSLGVAEPPVDPLAAVVFASLMDNVDQAVQDYLRDTQNGAKGGRPRKPTVTGGNPRLPSPPQEEADAEGEVEADVEGMEDTIAADKPHKPTRHKFGEYCNVLLADDELEKLRAEIPGYQDLIERLSGYIESTGKKYKSHYATIRNWYARDRKAGKGVQYAPEDDLAGIL